MEPAFVFDDERADNRAAVREAKLNEELAVEERAENGALELRVGTDSVESDHMARPQTLDLPELPGGRAGFGPGRGKDLFDKDTAAPLVTDEESPGRRRRPDDAQSLDLEPGFPGHEDIHARIISNFGDTYLQDMSPGGS